MFCLVVLYTFVCHFSCFSSVQPFMVQTSQNFQQAFASLNTDFISIYFSSFFSFAGYFGLLPSLIPNLKRDIQILAFFLLLLFIIISSICFFFQKFVCWHQCCSFLSIVCWICAIKNLVYFQREIYFYLPQILEVFWICHIISNIFKS